ncbi:GNAT family N-acetyltransferase [Micromonospora rifamycinica]|jgi:ribosomal protein S18 acetylase RimI-like enzyme|uniref:GNAT family N-acetyltransferase n=1 Tax=Micromonospora rifamycinica TaxID=291594 RepID=UPI00340253E6
MIESLTFRHYSSAEAEEITEQLIALYLDVHAGQGDFYGEDRYRRQLSAHRQRAGWVLVAAALNEELIGYVYGFPLAPDTRWWDGIEEPVPVGFTEEDGHRTFAICELLVRAQWRRQGVARALHDDLVRSRHEQRMTLLARPDNGPAQAAYRSWGWRTVTRLRPGWPDAPLFDVLVRDPGSTG